MSNSLKFLSLPNFLFLTEGIFLGDRQKCAEVIDSVLEEFNKSSKVPEKIVSWNKKGGLYRKPLLFSDFGRIALEVDVGVSSANHKPIYFAAVTDRGIQKEMAPLVVFNMHSPTLNIPMKIEVPMRALIKGDAKLKGTFSVYLHSLCSDENKVYVYYGITKRGWNLRFLEHVKSGLKEGSQRLLPRKLASLGRSRIEANMGNINNEPKLTAIISSLCAVGLDEDSAMDVEEYLVDKYSLSAKHECGLNMIPGGREGIKVLHSLRLNRERTTPDTEERENLLDEHLKNNLMRGSNIGVLEKWNDPDYAEAVICGHTNRLTAEQVRKIRFLAATGTAPNQIMKEINAIDVEQIRRVISGKTYSRILDVNALRKK